MRINQSNRRVGGLLSLASLVLLGGCASTTGPHPMESQIASKTASLNAREAALNARESKIQDASDAASESQATTTPAPVSLTSELLPPDAKSGECYARVWVEPKYRTVSEEIMVAEASERVAVVPATYTTGQEQVLVSEASTRLETIPAVYETVSEQKLVKEASQMWRLGMKHSAPPANQSILDAAAAAGINLDSASPGQCFHEHYRPATFEQVGEQILVAEGYEVVEAADAEYRWVEKQVLVREASSELQHFDAVYRTTSEQVVDNPAHTVWKKGTGPIQKIDEATGEIMCLIDVPATYKTITKRELVTAAGTREVAIPAEYKTVRVRELAREAQENRRTVEPKYEQFYVTKQTGEHSFLWHEIHDRTEPATTRTGRQLCLTAQPAQYKTVKRQVVKSAAYSRTIEIPANYETVKVTKMVEAAKEVRTEIPAVYKTVTHRELEADGTMEWRSILCETNMTVGTISDIQRSLKGAGYNPGPIDGVIGRQTIEAVNQFQRDKDLPVDRFINIETVKALEVSI